MKNPTRNCCAWGTRRWAAFCGSCVCATEPERVNIAEEGRSTRAPAGARWTGTRRAVGLNRWARGCDFVHYAIDFAQRQRYVDFVVGIGDVDDHRSTVGRYFHMLVGAGHFD